QANLQNEGCTPLLGAALALVALSPPLMHYGHASIEGHMIQHLMLGMYAPIGLVMAAPVTLALRTLPQRPARALVRWLASAPVRLLAHPITAAVLDIGAMFLLYLTPLYGLMHDTSWLGAVLHLHFLLAGCLFVWAIVGPDPAPHRPGPRLRLLVFFFAMALHGALSKYMYLHGYPLESGAALEQRRFAAELMYYGGDLAGLAMAGVFFAARYKARRPGVAPAL
ncbi:putative conserved integral membrane protein, partial [Salinisphaera shabanensis E1L3A]